MLVNMILKAEKGLRNYWYQLPTGMLVSKTSLLVGVEILLHGLGYSVDLRDSGSQKLTVVRCASNESCHL